MSEQKVPRRVEQRIVIKFLVGENVPSTEIHEPGHLSKFTDYRLDDLDSIPDRGMDVYVHHSWIETGQPNLL
jgi:hypothetical protein